MELEKKSQFKKEKRKNESIELIHQPRDLGHETETTQ